MLKRIVCVVLSVVALSFADLAHAGARVEAPKIADDAKNPPPVSALNQFQRFEISPIAMGAPFDSYDDNKAALANLQANLDERVKPLLAEWNGTTAGDTPRTLKIDPEVGYIRFISGGKRFFGGAFAGDSGILVKVKLTDAATGQVIGEPQFYQKANKFGAAWSFGATDKHMLIRLSGMIAQYLKDNYAAPTSTAIMVAPGHEEAPEK